MPLCTTWAVSSGTSGHDCCPCYRAVRRAAGAGNHVVDVYAVQIVERRVMGDYRCRMADPSANAVVVALVAVGGTVVGALISAATQAVVARTTSANQLKVLEKQARHDADRAWREDRRAVYAEFLTATARNADQIYAFWHATPEQRGRNGFPDSVSVSASVAGCIFALSNLSLIASPQVNDLAAALFKFCEQSSLAVLGGGEPPARPDEISNRAILVAMQRDLGLAEATELEGVDR